VTIKTAKNIVLKHIQSGTIDDPVKVQRNVARGPGTRTFTSAMVAHLLYLRENSADRLNTGYVKKMEANG